MMRQYRLFDAGMMKTMNKKTTNFLELRIPSCRCTSDVRGCQWHMHSGSDDLTHRIPRIISQEYYYISKRMVENDWVFLTGPSSVHTWIKIRTQNLNNRGPLMKHVIKQ
ncbi:MAG: hypothetical protein ACI90V_010377 [Bacillariaceae sp.]|jgi:hypothetical protein